MSSTAISRRCYSKCISLPYFKSLSLVIENVRNCFGISGRCIKVHDRLNYDYYTDVYRVGVNIGHIPVITFFVASWGILMG